MRKSLFIFNLVLGFVLSWNGVCAAEGVVVIPLLGDEPVGNATVGDVLVGKTFSNSSATGLTGTRPPASVEKTGQTICYNVDGTVRNCANSGQDGEYQNGVDFPVPRFRDNGDGTVTDNLTQLIWLKNADCFGQRKWAEALSYANGLADGQCGLSDASSAGDWYLPNARELHSLIHFGYSNPALPDTAGTGQWADGDPFFNVRSYFYWSSTTIAGYSNNAWTVMFATGGVGGILKGGDSHVWCVRGRQ